MVKSESAEYRAWSHMWSRCTNKNVKEYSYYGGRGITICAEWREFDNFLADMGQRPSSRHSIDRIDVNGNYEPANCRWATYTQQARNRRSNRIIEFQGERRTLAEWAEAIGLDVRTLHSRLVGGWSLERALTQRKHALRLLRNPRKPRYAGDTCRSGLHALSEHGIIMNGGLICKPCRNARRMENYHRRRAAGEKRPSV